MLCVRARCVRLRARATACFQTARFPQQAFAVHSWVHAVHARARIACMLAHACGCMISDSPTVRFPAQARGRAADSAA